MADKLPAIVPPSKPFPGSLTPGWNDPPPINDSRPAGRTKLNLNKRVAFPVQTERIEQGPPLTSFGQSNIPPVGNIPPPPSLLTHSSQGLHTANPGQ
ncbi:proline-rich receptor-like protein kinase PERK1 [Rhagoletis pomonella]|uniref:proline-rich receptor-like protein kinase PERK1 n=1 Tax=Rhagoletis pomonella TaxID=28610 RepID=UPI0017816BA6|nr:proline-rich receptor-like protein kinase PERK1 [Rhagoletis pomonella]XP_036341372.1 proline-rich receptor-like protein kinase PERK1 [Rhagoletis pomonella]